MNVFVCDSTIIQQLLLPLEGLMPVLRAAETPPRFLRLIL